MPITVFFNSFEKTVLGISECSKHKTKVQFLMYTFKKGVKKQYSQKIGKKSRVLCALEIFQFFLNFVF